MKNATIAKEEKEYTVTPEDILLDVEILLKDLYLGTVQKEGKELKIAFSNGENFVIQAKKV